MVLCSVVFHKMCSTKCVLQNVLCSHCIHWQSSLVKSDSAFAALLVHYVFYFCMRNTLATVVLHLHYTRLLLRYLFRAIFAIRVSGNTCNTCFGPTVQNLCKAQLAPVAPCVRPTPARELNEGSVTTPPNNLLALLGNAS